MSKLPELDLGSKESNSGTVPFGETVKPDGVPLSRLVAYIIDLCILFVIAAIFAIAASILNVLSFGLLAPLTALAAILLPVAYHSWFLAQKGRTPGMSFVGLKMLRHDNGRPVSILEAAINTVIFYVTVPATSGLILVVMLLNDQRRTLHEILSGTIVIREEDDGVIDA
ncbi:RDD family protein [Kiloniella sp. b19]|uniref:RDD family protein n=1 Tax=Kiloniella sp. GXU_MW_B19 TaxID=3141326 RepID=UPI0031D0D34B